MTKVHYDKEALRAMCEKVDLLEYASQTYDFHPKGSSGWACHCPRHVDKTPSLYIRPERDFFHCFSCGISGNIINWLIAFEHLSFPQALEKISQMSGVPLDNLEIPPIVAYYRQLNDAVRKSPENTSSIVRDVLPADYMNRFADEIPEEWIEEGIAPDIMKKYGIRIDKISNRIVYPLYDNAGNLVGVKGRTRFREYKDLGIPKYLPYNKLGVMDFFVGMKENRENILRKNEVIIFEGIKSGMKVEGWGYDNWLATETSWVNDEQTKILLRLGVKKIIVAYDSDVPPQKIRECTEILRRFSNIYFLPDPEGLLGGPSAKMSPCDKGQEVFEKLLQNQKKLM